MLTEALIALAASGGAAVAQAAGTDGWNGLRRAVARWFGRGDETRERAELERLDRTASELEAAAPDDTERIRARQETSWQTRFEMVLEGLPEAEREQLANALQALLAEHATALSHGVSASSGGVAAGRDITNRAEQGSIAAGVIHGGAHISSPPKPDPTEG
ncbi:hypothetical protein [Streptomyces sp. IB201691-2A2]|uniref:hypothetical protein n=1 Tax=Streptomyces sp. IB201691-2A2 TaxID=2561920 RepID=UPI001180533C|nr:hypothetical protein [Streptomyces sp. IB201691-2A2]TRO56338.1 hypothetical protein E4K73_47130 [Streptomyces sp. IB201691-2A2]